MYVQQTPRGTTHESPANLLNICSAPWHTCFLINPTSLPGIKTQLPPWWVLFVDGFPILAGRMEIPNSYSYNVSCFTKALRGSQTIDLIRIYCVYKFKIMFESIKHIILKHLYVNFLANVSTTCNKAIQHFVRMRSLNLWKRHIDKDRRGIFSNFRITKDWFVIKFILLT